MSDEAVVLDELVGASPSVGSTDDSKSGSAQETKKVNSLELAKLAVALATPILVFFFGLDFKNIDDRRLRDEDAARHRVEAQNRKEDLARQDRANLDASLRADVERKAADQRDKANRDFQAAQTALQRSAEDTRQRAQVDERDYQARLDALKQLSSIVVTRSDHFDALAREFLQRIAVSQPIIGPLAGAQPTAPAKATQELSNYENLKEDWDFSTRYYMLAFERTAAPMAVNSIEGQLQGTLQKDYAVGEACAGIAHDPDNMILTTSIEENRKYRYNCIVRAISSIDDCSRAIILQLSYLTTNPLLKGGRPVSLVDIMSSCRRI